MLSGISTLAIIKKENIRQMIKNNYQLKGEFFWQKIFEKIIYKENEENKVKQLDRIKEEMKKKQQIKIDKKIEKFLKHTQENLEQ